MNNNQPIPRNIDIVFCIDGTGSMTDCINQLKENALDFQTKFVTYLLGKNTVINSLRVRLITFRDYGFDSDAMETTEFFELPDEEDAFKTALYAIDAHGGDDNPENGFEALYYAMKSDFYTGPKDRQIIVLFTDAEALPLHERKGNPSYPADMVDDAGFQTMWACTDQSAKLRNKLKRLVLFAPAGTKYEELSKTFDQAFFKPVEGNEGLKEICFDDIITLISASV